MAFQILDIILLVLVAATLLTDIILAVNLRLVLPKYFTQVGYYPADNRRISLDEASHYCPCLIAIFPFGTQFLIQMSLVPQGAVPHEGKPNISATTARPKRSPALDYSRPLYVLFPKNGSADSRQSCVALLNDENQLFTSDVCMRDKNWRQMQARNWDTKQDSPILGVNKTINSDLVRIVL